MKMRFSFLLAITLIFGLPGCENNKQSQNNQKTDLEYAYIGTYTRPEGHVTGKARGIYALGLNGAGGLQGKKVAASLINPSFIYTDRDNRVLYAVSETGPQDGGSSYLYSFRIGEGGLLRLLDSAITNGYAACHVTATREGTQIFVANYVGGTVTIYLSKNGALQEHQVLYFEGSGPHSRQESSHTHSVTLSPDEQFLFVADLGSNKIWNYKADTISSQWVTNENQPFLEMEKAAGPRHMDFHPNGRWVYAINELNSTITSLAFDQEMGVLTPISSVSTLKSGQEIAGNTTADIHVHPSGKFVYGSNRGANTIAVFSIMEDGALIQIQQMSTKGEIPRNFALNQPGTELWVANQNTDNIVIYAVDTERGELSFSREMTEVMTPVCISLP